MKELKLPEEKGTTDLIDDKSFVGVAFHRGGRNVLFKKEAREFCSLDGDLDVSLDWTCESKREYAEKVLKLKAGKVYIFDSSKELLEWFSSSK